MISFDVNVTVSPQIYVAKNYGINGVIAINQLSILSDADLTNEILHEPANVFVEVDDPCFGEIVAADDFITFLNEVNSYLKNLSPFTYPVTIPLSDIPSFTNSSVNLIGNGFNLDNLELNITSTSEGGGSLNFDFNRDCGKFDLLCQFQIDNLIQMTDVETFRSIVPVFNIYNPHPLAYFRLEITALMTTGQEQTFSASSSCLPFVPCEKRKLCNRPFYIETKPDNPCTDYVIDIEESYAIDEYHQIIDNTLNHFRSLYAEQCMSTTETFNDSRTLSEHHFTLYNYDQAGNLASTIPPLGVHPITDINQLANAANYRKAPFPPYTPVYPNHDLSTNYSYNSFNNITNSTSVDFGEKKVWYDRLGRPLVTQDGRQANYQFFTSPDGSVQHIRYTYFVYDQLGRVIETGEIIKFSALTLMSDEIAASPELYQNWLDENDGTSVYVTKTIYDENYTQDGNVDDLFGSEPRLYLRNRISSVLHANNYSDRDGYHYQYATHYDYDIHGNVKTMLQEFKDLEDVGQSIKRIDYKYDLISGNVNELWYQHGKPDAFYHKYKYDADNRITSVETSHDRIIWDKDAAYIYYDHGPLARTELGKYTVQGCDYVYTLQGWIKGVNSNTLYSTRDPGKDGNPTQTHPNFAPDVVGYSLGYFENDYKSNFNFAQDVSFLASSPPPASSPPCPPSLNNLYNGNISHMVTAMKKDDGSLLDNLPSTYTYDQLHRIKSMQKYTAIDNVTNAWTNTTTPAFATAYSYDANGNITSLNRRDGTQEIDHLSYVYDANIKNRLVGLHDAVSPNPAIQGSITSLGNNNYTYDLGGNLRSDVSEKISRIEWDQNGKIRKIIREQDSPDMYPEIEYDYNGNGQRVRKTIKTDNNKVHKYSYYVYDAQGYVIAVFGANTSSNIQFQINEVHENEFHIYGSSRLGIKLTQKPTANLINYTDPKPDQTERIAGTRQYEITNHLGNVLATISDYKLLGNISSNQNSPFRPKYRADILSYADYYPFGWEMPDRHGSKNNYDYRYGFNGKEKDNEVAGNGNHYDYGFRVYNPRIARFLSVDPLTSSYPWYTPYQFAGNKPIANIDLDGLEETSYTRYLDKVYSNPTTAHAHNVESRAQAKAFLNWTGKVFYGILEGVMAIPNAVSDMHYAGRQYDVGNVEKGKEFDNKAKVEGNTIALDLVAGLALRGAFRAFKVPSNFSGLAKKTVYEAAENFKNVSRKKKPYMISTVVDGKTGKTYTGVNGGIKDATDIHPDLKNALPDKSLEDGWDDVANCAECDAVNQALHDKVNIKDISEMHTVQYDNISNGYIDVERCKNCKITTKEINTTSDKKF